MVADSITGYCYGFLIYDGRSRTIKQIVLFLIDDLLYKNYRLYMDNYYNSGTVLQYDTKQSYIMVTIIIQ